MDCRVATLLAMTAAGMEILFVYVTCPSEEIAAQIARGMVEDKLAACANILPRMTSIYRWQGKTETADEAVLILKTTQGSWPALRDAIKAAHPYEVPCIVALPVADGFAPFLAWVAGETSA